MCVTFSCIAQHNATISISQTGDVNTSLSYFPFNNLLFVKNGVRTKKSVYEIYDFDRAKVICTINFRELF